ncbi:hypothetical protein ASE16_11175 [Leifsonia sp. Root227]|uniref:hypothetical protein n=1 Tax=Leifsonia sp. Root227 TaxID=1736496 RepID=UPI0006FB0291|nr:hypothetical protein [Leifsonia sp. Root227]KRC49314.1 hypothetical protein ASE16_11175 [Leifsonia sp. Root227]
MSSDSSDEPRRPLPRTLIAVATATNAASVLSTQLLGLISLAPADFGLFSLQYLLFALASSVTLSVVSEPWMRTDLRQNHRSTWADYSSIQLYVSMAAAVVTLVFSLLVPGLAVIALTGALAVGVNVYRAGVRYHQVRTNQWNRVLVGDVVAFTLTVATWVVLLLLGMHGLMALSIAWLTGGVLSALVAHRPHLRGPRSIGAWFGTHRDHIVPLLKDSTLMDLGSIGTPFVVAPLLGIADFGVYRAVSNVAAPVRLILNPLRPVLAGLPAHSHRVPRRIVISIAGAFFFGVAAYLALLGIGLLHIQLGSLSAVVTYAIPTALFVSANFFGHYYYIIARSHAAQRGLLIGRIVQTSLAIILPIIGALAFGLAGAIWCYAGATVVSSTVWVLVVTGRREAKQ